MQTRWKVLAGAPGSGKTSTIGHLAALGHQVRPEGATMYIQGQLDAGRLLEDICAVHNQPALQAGIAQMNALLEAEIAEHPHVPYILDRCIVEVLAYCRLYRHGDEQVRPHILRRYHPRVLQLDRLPFVPNQVRCENDDVAAQLDLLIEQVYRDEGYEVIRIPVPEHPDPDEDPQVRTAWSVARRTELILRHWND